MSGHISDNNHLEEKWVWQALRQMVFLEGPYLWVKAEQLMSSCLSHLVLLIFCNLSSLKDE
jgi:hypothetical protein